MYLRVTAEEARKRLLSIPHSTCTKAIDEHWKVDQDGKVRAQSVLWLFCWAKTGMNSEEARRSSVLVFDTILSRSFASLDAVLDHQYARKARYSSGDIEDEFETRILRKRL
uniref:Uncharacterized protein n=1 Tax=Acidobacterium capsulatum TaxID=33075 RepID=A0A7V4XU88_9BACT